MYPTRQQIEREMDTSIRKVLDDEMQAPTSLDDLFPFGNVLIFAALFGAMFVGVLFWIS